MVYTNLMHRMVLIAAMLVAIVSLSVNMIRGYDLLSASFIAICVMLGAALVFMLAFKAVGDILQKQLLQEKSLDEVKKTIPADEENSNAI